jgi:hypothetical protein
LTGDTVHFGKGAWGDAANASIMCVAQWTRFHARGITLFQNINSDLIMMIAEES